MVLGISDKSDDGGNWYEEQSLCEKWRGGVSSSESPVSRRFSSTGDEDPDNFLLRLPLSCGFVAVDIGGRSIDPSSISLAFVLGLIPSLDTK